MGDPNIITIDGKTAITTFNLASILGFQHENLNDYKSTAIVGERCRRLLHGDEAATPDTQLGQMGQAILEDYESTMKGLANAPALAECPEGTPRDVFLGMAIEKTAFNIVSDLRDYKLTPKVGLEDGRCVEKGQDILLALEGIVAFGRAAFKAEACCPEMFVTLCARVHTIISGWVPHLPELYDFAYRQLHLVGPDPEWEFVYRFYEPLANVSYEYLLARRVDYAAKCSW